LRSSQTAVGDILPRVLSRKIWKPLSRRFLWSFILNLPPLEITAASSEKAYGIRTCNRSRKIWLVRSVALMALLVAAVRPSQAQVTVPTYQFNNQRSGVNSAETILTPANVNSTTFGKLFSQSVDGYVFAQPLYVPGVTINGAVHNVVYVATEHDSVYAFDADSNTGANALPLWKTSFLSSGVTSVPSSSLPSGGDDINPEIGITGTPAIDLSMKILYVVAETLENNGTSYVKKLHALDITTGAEKPGSPIVITATVTVPGQNPVTFYTEGENQRAGLLLYNGVVYVAFGAHGDGNTSILGWILGYSYNGFSFSQVFVFCTEPSSTTGWGGGIWMSGQGLLMDTGSNMFVATGNGEFDTTGTPPVNYGDSILRFDLTQGATVQDYFTPTNQSPLSLNDQDVGSGGIALLPTQGGPNPDLLVQVGKIGTIYVVNRDPGMMGQFSTTTDKLPQEIVFGTQAMFSSPIYFNGKVYFWGQNDVVRAFTVTNGMLSNSPTDQGSDLFGFPGAVPTISANGTSNAVLWALESHAASSSGPGGPAVLFAYNANDIAAGNIYNSNQNSSRDNPGGAIKFAVPTVVNGKVYVGSEGVLSVYGELSAGPPPAATPVITPGSETFTGSVTVSITDSTPGFSISFTTDGSTPPTSPTSQTYSAPFSVTTTTTVNAVAMATGFSNSSIGTATYTLQGVPSISGLSPASGPIGTAVTITGTNFGSTQGTSSVTFNGTTASVTTWSGTSIATSVPTGATTGSVVVTVGGVASNGSTFTVTAPAPAITSLNPTSGAIGAAVTITGTNFGSTQGTSSVTFNGTTATVTTWSATSIATSVPTGATTGNVVVKVGGVSSNGSPFTVSSGGGGAATWGTMDEWLQMNTSSPGTVLTTSILGAGTIGTADSWSLSTSPITGFTIAASQGAMGGSITVAGTTYPVGTTTQSMAFDHGQTAPRMVLASPSHAGVTTVVANGFITFGPPNVGFSAANFDYVLLGDSNGHYAILQLSNGNANGAGNCYCVRLQTDGNGTVQSSNTAITPGHRYSYSLLFDEAGGIAKLALFDPSNGFAQVGSTMTAAQKTGSTFTFMELGNSEGGKATGSTSYFEDTMLDWTNHVFPNSPQTGVASPTITSLNPTSGAAGTAVTITGTNFGATQGTSSVTFNGTAATVTSWSATSVVTTVPAGATTGSVVVTVGGVASNGSTFTVTLPAPTITTLNPTSGVVGAAVTITGTNFGSTQGTSSVTFNGTIATVTTWSATSIATTVPAGATTGSVVVTVGGTASNGSTFTVTLPAPTITNLNPTSGVVGAVVTITGTNFGSTQGTSSVAFNGTPATVTSWTATSIATSVPTGATTGSVVVTVGGVASNGSTFTVTLPAPTITNLNPTSGVVGAAVTITGTNFGSTQGTSSVTFNGTTATVTSWSATSIATSVPTGATTGNVIVKVGGVSSNGSTFTVTLPAPTITTLNPASGVVGAAVTITGTNFGSTQGTSSVTFNGTTAAVTTWSSTSIATSVPAGATTGSVVVTVGGVASNGSTFTVTLPAPTITTLNPTSGVVGTAVTVTGTNFGSTQGTSSVTFNGTTAAVTIWNSTSIATSVPAGATTGNVIVKVGGVSSNGSTFTVTLPAPTITNLNPTSGVVGTAVTVTGTNFGSTQGTSSVTFNGTTATVTTWSSTSIATSVPTGATTGSVVVTVGGVASNGSTFTVTALAPSITSLNPTSGAIGAAVTITGTNFGSTQGTSSVTFNGTTASVTTWSATSIATSVPTGATTGNVVVKVSGVSSNGSPFTVSSGGGGAATWGTMDEWLQMNTSSPGTVLTTSILGAGTIGTADSWSLSTSPITGFTVAASQGAMGGSITVAGTTYPVGTTTQSMAFDHGQSVPRMVLGSPSATGISTVVANGFITFGPPNVGFSGANFDYVLLGDANGHYAILQLNNGNANGTGSCYCVRLETDGNGALQSSNTTITPGHRYSYSLLFDEAGGVAKLALFDTSNGFNQVGSTMTAAQKTGSTFTFMELGNSGGGTASGSTSYFEDTMLDWTNHVFPNSPVTGVASPSITNLNPTSGAVGTAVTITGTNFGSTQGTSTVTFNGTAATATSWSATSIATTVPTGATTGNVVVTVGGVASNGVTFAMGTSNCGETGQTGTDSQNGDWGFGTPCVTGNDANGYAPASFEFWVGSPASASFDLGIYADNAGSPGSLLCHTGTATLTPVAGWNITSLSGKGCPTLTANTRFWMGYVTGSNTIQQGTVNGTCPGTSLVSVFTNSQQGSAVLPSSFGVTAGTPSCYSMYLVLNNK
jgi:hypothetical protein